MPVSSYVEDEDNTQGKQMITNEDTLFRPAPPSIHPVPPISVPASANTIQRTASCAEYLVTDYDGISALTDNERVLDSWATPSLLLLGADPISMLAFFSDAFSMQIHAYDLRRGTWVDDQPTLDPDFPRFHLEDDTPLVSSAHCRSGAGRTAVVMMCVVDLDTGCRHHFHEAFTPTPSSRLSA
jgi:hypothetical protein